MDQAVALADWLAAAHSREASGHYNDCKLAPIRRVLAHLPQPPAPVTVAGTKGKGSILRFLEGALVATGERTCCFTSPHVRRVEERWRLDGAVVDTPTAWAAAEQVTAAEAASGTQLAYFERCFAIAVVLASEHGGHFLLEVGLGGRLDCANALDARIAILAHIGYDHCAILGHDLLSIAREKCAIARPGRPFLVTPQIALPPGDLLSAMPTGCQPIAVEVDSLPPEQILGLAGEHQRGNAATALAAFRTLLPDHDPAIALRSFADARLAARCQLVEQAGRRLLVDAAHHDLSIAAALAEADRRLRPGWRLIIGLARDKEIGRILPVLGETARIHRCAFDWPRSLREDEWPASLRDRPWHPHVGHALAAIPAGCDCCIVGSFYLAGEALALLAPDDPLPG